MCQELFIVLGMGILSNADLAVRGDVIFVNSLMQFWLGSADPQPSVEISA